MKVWLITCLVLFALVQFYEWAKGFILPLPIYVIAGAFLAIASNYDKGIAAWFSAKNTLVGTAQANALQEIDE